MSSKSQPHRILPLVLLLIAALTLTLATSSVALGEGAPYQDVPGYPISGCRDVVSAGAGMMTGQTVSPLALNVPGPVVDAYLVWIGTIDVGAPDAPAKSDLVVNGVTVVGNQSDVKDFGSSVPAWYMWRADVGPNGYNLVQQGSNSFAISGWVESGGSRRNGVSLVVVYNTGSCTNANQVELLDSMDWLYEGMPGEETTAPMVFEFNPTPVSRSMRFLLHHGGVDQWNLCRPHRVWAAIGSGEPPSNIINYGWVSTGVNGGALLLAQPFSDPSCGSQSYPPVTSFKGGLIGPQWSVAEVTLDVPAGATYVVLQAESVKTSEESWPRPGESGAWFAQAVIPLANPELKISKSDGVDLADPADNLTYTIKYENYGYGPAEDVVIVDTLPAQASYVSATNGGVYDTATHTVTWNVGSLLPGQSGQVAVTVKLDPVFEAGTTTITNAAAISTTSTGELDLTDNAATDSTDVFAKGEVSIEKTATPDPVDAGGDLTYIVDWTVGGNAYAKSVTIVDTLPADVTFVSAADGGLYDPVSRTVTWLLGDVTPVTSGSFQAFVKVKTPLYDGTLIENKVVISDAAGNTDDASFISTVRADHVLSITKADDPDPVEKGAQLTYTLTWGVTGNEPADNVVLVDQLPFGTQFVSASGGGVFDPLTRIVTWNLGNKVPGDTGSVTLVVLVNKDFPNGFPIENQATISDAKPGKEKQVTEVTQVVQTPEGSIGDTVWVDLNGNGIAEPGEPGLGGVDLVLYNAGPDGLCGTADDVVVANTSTDANGKYLFDAVPAGTYCVDVVDATVPAGLSLVSGSDPHGPVTLVEGQDYKDADFGYHSALGAIGDRVWNDANGNGIQDPGEVGIAGVTLNLLNAGPDGLCGTADDTVLATTTTGPGGNYLFAGLAPGTYCVDVTDTAGKLTGAVLTGGADPHGPIDLAADETYLDADFGYRNAACAGQVGNLVFYDANRNGVFEPALGEVGIPGVTLNLVSGDAVIGSTTSGADGSYLFSGLCDGAYQIVVTDLNSRLVGYTQTYGVPNTDNNGQVSPFAVTITGSSSVLYADFGYADGHLLTVSKSNDIPAGQAVEAGAQMVYTINYSVSGREPAPNVVLRDQLPMQVDFVSASHGGVYDAALRVVTWMLGDLAPGSSGSVTLTVRVKRPLPNNSYIFNTVVISDDAGVTDQATDVVRVHAVPILSLTKTNTPTGEVEPSDTIEYELCFGNTGNGNATGVLLVDPIPVNTTYVAGSAVPAATYDEVAKTLTWNLGVLAPDAQACGTFEVTVNLTIVGLTGQANVPLSFSEWNALTIDNVATLKSDQLPDLTATASNPLNATVKPEIFKTVNKSQVFVAEGVQETLIYTVTVINNGTANATNVVVTDEIHPKLQNAVVTATKGTATYDAVTRVWTVTVGTLGPGESVLITIKAVTEPVAPGTSVPFYYDIVNVATVSFVEGAPRNSNEVTVRVVAVPPEEIPEPGTWLLLGSGLAGLAGYTRMRVQSRRRKS